MTKLRIEEGLRYRLERIMGHQPGRSGLFVLSLATNRSDDFVYELVGVNSREEAIKSLVSTYGLADQPQCRALGVDELGYAREVGRYFIQLEKSGRLLIDETLAIEQFDGPDDVGELTVCDVDLHSALAAVRSGVSDNADGETAAARPSRPRL